MHLRVYKHYSIASGYSLAAAITRLEKAQKRNPDRCYIITTNGRAWSGKYKVEQVRQFDYRIDMPPRPTMEQYASGRDFSEALSMWTIEYERHLEKFGAELAKPMNR